MPILTATEVTMYSDISCTVGTIIEKGYIPYIQEKIAYTLNNFFTTDLYLQDMMVFDEIECSVRSLGNKFSDWGFCNGDDIYIYNSYRNDGYNVVKTVTLDKLFVTNPVHDELSGKSILISVVEWPLEVKHIAARMIAYDHDERPKRKGITSRSLGPLSESYGELDDNGYPKSITDDLAKYRIARAY